MKEIVIDGVVYVPITEKAKQKIAEVAIWEA